MAANATYVLGRSTSEYSRLVRQSEFLAAPTLEMLRAAGLSPGMRVLDVGCGAGGVTLHASGVVGGHGSVVGLDQDGDVLQFARERARAAGARNATFLHGTFAEAGELFERESFDALIGRFVLVHQADPTYSVRSLLPLLRPGGIVAFLEPELGRVAVAQPAVPLLDEWTERLQDTLAIVGVQMNMGTMLAAAFVAAGLRTPHTALSVLAGGGLDYFGYEYWAETARSMAPVMRRLGMLTPEEDSIETLGDRLREAIVCANGFMTTQVVVAAWCRYEDTK